MREIRRIVARSRARVVEVRAEAPGRLVLQVQPVDQRDQTDAAGPPVPAVALTDLVGSAFACGDQVWINTTARRLGLGTGGWDFVVAPSGAGDPSAPGRPGEALDRRQGHIVKLRYTPVQVAVQAAEEPGGGYHRALRRGEATAAGLAGLPVAVLSPHSMVGPVAAAFWWEQRCLLGDGDGVPGSCGARLAYVMTDSACLSAPVGRSLGAYRRAGLVQLVVTAGQAYGGDLEAVHPASALVVARLAGADAVLVGPGPGVVGTGTALGTTELEVGILADLVGALGGQAVVPVRLSYADRRCRHQGISHHHLTALTRLADRPATVVLPRLTSPALRRRLLTQVVASGVARRHRVVEVDPAPALNALGALPEVPRTMGRGPDQDPWYFLGCLAAGRLLAHMAVARVVGRPAAWPCDRKGALDGHGS